MKLCKDCKYCITFYPKNDTQLDVGHVGFMIGCALSIDVDTGENYQTYLCRSDDGICGPKAKRFKPK